MKPNVPVSSFACIVIVGAGPAGMMAAVAAAEGGAHVLLFEQLDQPGRKLLVTGGGHCNLSTTVPEDELMNRFGRHGRFMQPSLAALSQQALRDLFLKLGVPTRVIEGKKVLPVSDRASDVLHALRDRCKALGVETSCHAAVTAINVEDSRLTGVATATGIIAANSVIMATGGKSYARLGGTGSGFALAKEIGHTIVNPVPALVPLVASETWVQFLSGVSLQNSRIWVDVPRHARTGCTGDILFTHRGISGPAVLDISGEVAELLTKQETVPVCIDLTPGVTKQEWMVNFDSWQLKEGRKLVANLVDTHLPASLAKAVCHLAGIPREVTASRLSNDQRKKLAQLLTSFGLTITATEGFDKAMVTRGGVALKEVDPDTLESRIVHGLFFAGEVLDLDGPTGGFNLQWAFSSGWQAGRSAGTPR